MTTPRGISPNRLSLLVAVLAAAIGMAGCSLLTEGPELVEADATVLDAGIDASDADDATTNDATIEPADSGCIGDACNDAGMVDPLQTPQWTSHQIGLVTETNAKFADRLNVLLQYERLVYGEDEIATLGNRDGAYPDHDLYLIRTGGIESLRSTPRPIIIFAPWAEDDLLLVAEPAYSNNTFYSSLLISDNPFDIPTGTVDPYLTETEESWLGRTVQYSESVNLFASADGDPEAPAFTQVSSEDNDINGDPFAGPRTGLYTAFHRQMIDSDFEPAFDIWTTQMWEIYRSVRETHLPDDATNGTRSAIFVHDGQTGMGAAVVIGRLERLGFQVDAIDAAKLVETGFPDSDLIVLWSGLDGSLTDHLPAQTPILAFPSDGDLMVAAGLFGSSGSPIRGIEHRWAFESPQVVPPLERGDTVEIVNTNQTTLSLPAADDIFCVAESRIAADSVVLARLAENDNVTAFVVESDRRSGYVSLNADAVARANVEFISLFDRMVLWLTL